MRRGREFREFKEFKELRERTIPNFTNIPDVLSLPPWQVQSLNSIYLLALTVAVRTSGHYPKGNHYI